MPAQDGAVAWLGNVSRDAQFNSIAATSLSKGTTLSFNDIPDGKYYLKVRAQDKQGLEGYDATHEFNLHARPFAPVANVPTQSAIVREANPDFAWTTIEQANAYLFEIAKDAEFKDIIDSRKATSNGFKAEKYLQPGQYYWRLASLDGNNQGPYTAANSFTYKAKPNAPDISQLKVKVERNKVFVNTLNPPEGLTYQAILHNEMNLQKSVWSASGLDGEFSFLLKEYGKQTLILRLLDADGVMGPDAVYEFNASPP
jgi:predicted phage tail protein